MHNLSKITDESLPLAKFPCLCNVHLASPCESEQAVIPTNLVARALVLASAGSLSERALVLGAVSLTLVAVCLASALGAHWRKDRRADAAGADWTGVNWDRVV